MEKITPPITLTTRPLIKATKGGYYYQVHWVISDCNPPIKLIKLIIDGK